MTETDLTAEELAAVGLPEGTTLEPPRPQPLFREGQRVVLAAPLSNAAAMPGEPPEPGAQGRVVTATGHNWPGQLPFVQYDIAWDSGSYTTAVVPPDRLEAAPPPDEP